MAKKPAAKPKQEPELRATSLKMTPELWKAVHIRAMEEDRDFREVVWSALELYLKSKVQK